MDNRNFCCADYEAKQQAAEMPGAAMCSISYTRVEARCGDLADVLRELADESSARPARRRSTRSR